jgi:predicted unusual protein kinase regulating ubiquinone biosynthesis (AarF/ABC1/UbiB family)
MLEQFIETIHEEMDYNLESSNLKTIKKNIRHFENVIVPSVYDDYSTKSVLTMEYVPGIKITNIEALDAKGIDRQKLVIDVHRVFFTMLLRNSIFHADPHPGNISVSDNGSLILYDYGMVGKIDNETRLKLIRLYLALIEKDPPRTVNAMNDLGMLMPDYNRSIIEKALELAIRGLHGKKPSEMEVKALLELANKTMSHFPFILPKHLALYMRMTSIIEGIYKIHKVDFKFVKILRQILEEEHLIKDAYIEEIKYSFNKFTKSLDAAFSLGTNIDKFLDDIKLAQKKRSPIVLISGSIFAGAVFVGSVLLYSTNELGGILGMISSAVIMGFAGFFRKL